MQIAELTTSSVDLTQRLHDILVAAQERLGLQAVYYGAQDLVPSFPAVAVESLTRTRAQAGTHRFAIKLKTQIFIYHGKVQSSTITKKETEVLAELVEAALMEDYTLEDLVLFGTVTQLDPGVSVLGGAMVQSSRLIYEALSREGF